MNMSRWLMAGALLVGAAVEARPAFATFSIGAADGSTRSVGGAAASCVGGADLTSIYASVPGRGVVLSQARSSIIVRDEARQLLASGHDPKDIVNAVSASSFDLGAAYRQFAVVDVHGGAAVHTGDSTEGVAISNQGRSGAYTFAIQGNTLSSAKVIERGGKGFSPPEREDDACDLAGRLMSALRAAKANGEGDRRCTANGISANAAFLRVEDADGHVVAELAASDTGTEDAVDVLESSFAAWRKDHPCEPRPSDEGGCTTVPGRLPTGSGAMAWSLFLALAALMRRARRRG